MSIVMFCFHAVWDQTRIDTNKGEEWQNKVIVGWKIMNCKKRKKEKIFILTSNWIYWLLKSYFSWHKLKNVPVGEMPLILFQYIPACFMDFLKASDMILKQVCELPYLKVVSFALRNILNQIQLYVYKLHFTDFADFFFYWLILREKNKKRRF